MNTHESQPSVDRQAVTSTNFVALALRTEVVPENPVPVPQSDMIAMRLIVGHIIEIGALLNQFKRKIYYSDPKADTALAVNRSNLHKIFSFDGCRLAGTASVEMSIENRRLLHGMVGKTTELAELWEALSPAIFDGKEADMVNVGEELGDDKWYDAVLIDTAKLTMNGVLDGNIQKLQKRYPDKFSTEAAINRNLGAERKSLESTLGSTPSPVNAAVVEAPPATPGPVIVPNSMDAATANLTYGERYSIDWEYEHPQPGMSTASKPTIARSEIGDGN